MAHPPGRSRSGDDPRRLRPRLHSRGVEQVRRAVRKQSRRELRCGAQRGQRQPRAPRRNVAACCFRETSRLGPGPFPPTPTYPLAISRAAGVNLFDPDWEVGLADSFSAGIQRAIARDMAIEVRYVGTRGRNLVEIEDWNEVNLVENGFLDEFKLAQANLASNMRRRAAARRSRTPAPGTGTSPLPTYLAYFTGSRSATDPSAYTGPRWSNGTIVGRFAPLNPNPGGVCGRSAQRCHLARQRPRRRCPGELLRAQSGRRRRERPREQGLDAVRRGSGGAAPADVARARDDGELQLREGLDVAARFAPRRSRARAGGRSPCRTR